MLSQALSPYKYDLFCLFPQHFLILKITLIIGFFAMQVSLAAFALMVWQGVPVHVVYDEFLPLATTAILFSFVLSVYLYARALAAPANQLAAGGNSGKSKYLTFYGTHF